MSHKIFFISDLHLSPESPEINKIFFNFLANLNKEDALYILGDLFEIWIGDDDETAFNLSIQQALRDAVDRGIQIYFLPGNRDFLIGQQFLAQSKCKLLSDEYVTTIYGTPVLLMHGDTLCTLDTNYLKWRQRARGSFLQKIFLKTPLFIRQHIAKLMRVKSQKYTQFASPDIMDVTPSAVVDVMKKHQVPMLIHGHTHRPAIHTVKLNHESAIRIVLAAWHQKGNTLVWHNNGERELIYF